MYVSKRVLALVLGVVLATSIAGCSDDDALRSANAEIAKGNETIAYLNEQVAQGNATIDYLNDQVAQGNATIRSLKAQVALADEKLDGAHAEIVKGNESIVYLQEVIEQNEGSIADLADANQQWERDYETFLGLDPQRFLREAYHNRNAEWIATRWELREARSELDGIQSKYQSAEAYREELKAWYEGRLEAYREKLKAWYGEQLREFPKLHRV